MSQTLTVDEITKFRTTGYLVIDGVFSPHEVETLRNACNREAADSRWKQADHTVHSLELCVRHAEFLALAKDPRITDRIRALIGDDIQLQHSKLAAQPVRSNQGGAVWHQDFAYFPHTNTDLVAVMVMLDPATRENGCMQMVEGSHQLGLLDHSGPDGLFTAQCQRTVWQEHPERVKPVEAGIGGISIHHCLTVHGSGPNPSGQPRRGAVFQYRADDAYQLADGIWQDTGLLICGERRERARCDAGILQLPRSSRYPGEPFGSAWHQEGELANRLNDSSQTPD